ncbi:related to iron/ascorbate family oxidoreductases [Rhynchosporium agropyri]|uniref:Related to iron/ascorbate family oxidoreductases n=1 Tax=Rhynchosporium agropyri TaxID=914238 RepID=A0A1E1JYJ9_9HELO|nr:related to iron/ascorbate family oxidoreductases [Rhynchosporium agropyri]
MHETPSVHDSATVGPPNAAKSPSMEWAQLLTIDFALLHSSEGQQKLAKQLETALCEHGIFYVANHGIPTSEMDLQVAIAQAFFELPLEEKMKFHSMEKFLAGRSEGYRPVSINQDITGVEDNIQIYMMTLPYESDNRGDEHPAPISIRMDAIRQFVKLCHYQVLHPLFRLIASILELPNEDALVAAHALEGKSTSQFRYMHYTAPRAGHAHEIYAGAHTDMDMLTLHFPQPIAALQVSANHSQASAPAPAPAEGDWHWVRPREDAVLVNVGDALASLSGGYFQAALHRVHRPPAGQDQLDRVGTLYFSRAENDLVLDPPRQSAKLQRLGLLDMVHPEIGRGTTMERWVTRRQQHKQDQDVDEDVHVHVHVADAKEEKGGEEGGEKRMLLRVR